MIGDCFLGAHAPPRSLTLLQCNIRYVSVSVQGGARAGAFLRDRLFGHLLPRQRTAAGGSDLAGKDGGGRRRSSAASSSSSPPQSPSESSESVPLSPRRRNVWDRFARGRSTSAGRSSSGRPRSSSGEPASAAAAPRQRSSSASAARTRRKESTLRSAWEEQVTYYVRQNLNPKWDDQAFVFDLSPEAPQRPRMFWLRLRVLDHDFIAASSFLGQVGNPVRVRSPAFARSFVRESVCGHGQVSPSACACRVALLKVEVPLTKLHNEDVMEGWLPLTPKANMMADLGGGLSSSRRGSSGASSLLGHRVTGALRVRLQWVHSLPALVAYRLQLSRGVAQSTEQLLAARRRALHGLCDAARAAHRRRRPLRRLSSAGLESLGLGGSGLGGHGANHRLGSSTHSERAGSIDSEGVDRKGGGGDSGSDTSRRGAGPLRSVRYASGSRAAGAAAAAGSGLGAGPTC